MAKKKTKKKTTSQKTVNKQPTNKQSKEDSCKVDLHCYSNMGTGKDSILRLYHIALERDLGALVITDKISREGIEAFYKTFEFLSDMERMKKDGWEQKIPIIVGAEYTWPEWLVNGFSVQTLIFGAQAVDQIVGLEKYRSVSGYDVDGNLYMLEKVDAEAKYFTYDDDPNWRTIFVDGASHIVQHYSDKRKRWLDTSNSPKSIPDDLYEESEQVPNFKYKKLTGENIGDVWDFFTDALTTELEEDPETGIMKSGKEIPSAVILCSPDPALITTINSSKDLLNKLPERFLRLLDAIEISYHGRAKKVDNKNISRGALDLSESLDIVPLINSQALQAEVLGVVDKVCNEFKGKLTSEEDLINALLEKRVTEKHLESASDFCKNAKEISVSEDGLAQDVVAENDLGIIWNTGAEDEF